MAVDGGARCPVALSDRAVKVEFPAVRSILFWYRARVGANDGSVIRTENNLNCVPRAARSGSLNGVRVTERLLKTAGSPEKIGAAGLLYAGPVEQNSRPATDKERGGWPGALLSSNVVSGESDVKRPLSQVSPGPIRRRYTSFLLGPVVSTGAAGLFVRSRARAWRCVARYADYPTTPMVLKPQVAMWEISYTDSESAAPRLPGLALLTCSQSGPAHPIVTPDGSFSMSRALFFLQVSLYLRALRKTCSPAHERKREPLVALVEG